MARKKSSLSETLSGKHTSVVGLRLEENFPLSAPELKVVIANMDIIIDNNIPEEVNSLLSRLVSYIRKKRNKNNNDD